MKPAEIVELMMSRDAFSQWLGIAVAEVSDGHSELSMTVREDMVNGFGIAHGGITFALADSALAFSSNAGGVKSVSIDTSISHLAPVKLGDRLYAVATRESESPRIGHYTVKVSLGTAEGVPVAIFRGTVYRRKELWSG